MNNPAECGIGDYAPCAHTTDPLATLLAATGDNTETLVIAGITGLAVLLLGAIIVSAMTHRR